MLEERVLDLPMREADVAIRMKEPSQADLIRKRLMNIKMRLYATPDYLAAAGTPEKPDGRSEPAPADQPARRHAAGRGGRVLVQELMSHDIPSTLTVNNYFGVLQAVLNNLGIGVLPDYLTEDFPNLVRVLPDVQSRAMCRCSSPTPRNCAIPSAWRPSANSSRKRSSPIASASRHSRKDKSSFAGESRLRTKICTCGMTGLLQAQHCQPCIKAQEHLLPSLRTGSRCVLPSSYLPVGLGPSFCSAFFLVRHVFPWFCCGIGRRGLAAEQKCGIGRSGGKGDGAGVIGRIRLREPTGARQQHLGPGGVVVGVAVERGRETVDLAQRRCQRSGLGQRHGAVQPHDGRRLHPHQPVIQKRDLPPVRLARGA
jgi:hypothetical protein